MEAALFHPSGRITFKQPGLAIGRAPDNQLVINDPLVSLHHAEIRPAGQGFYILDLGSKNHTFVNDYQLAANTPQTLKAGDRIRFGTHAMYTYELKAFPQEMRAALADVAVRGNPTPYNQPAAFTDRVQDNRPPYQQNGQNYQQEEERQPKKIGGLSKLQWIITGVAVPIITALIAGGVLWHNSPTPSIPQLHSSYNGTMDALYNSTRQLYSQISISSLSEDTSTGDFTADITMLYSNGGHCAGQVSSGSVNQNSQVTFTFYQQASSPQAGSNISCAAAQFDFNGKINSAGAIIGNWSVPNWGINGSFNIS